MYRFLQNRRLIALLAFSLSACHPRTNDNSNNSQLKPDHLDPKNIVARVNGQAISKSQIEKLAKEKNIDAKDALDQLIENELFAQYAKKQGLVDAKKIKSVKEKTLARRLLQTVPTKLIKKNKLAIDLLKQAYQKNIRRYKHPELVDVEHILCLYIPNRHGPEIKKAKDQCVEIMKKQTENKKLGLKEFERLILKARVGYPKKRMVKLEKLTTPRHGETVEPFAKAAFALKKPGDISPPTVTNYGTHFIYLKKRHPAVDKSFEEVEDEIREKAHAEISKIMFQRWAKELEKKYHVKINLTAFEKSLAQKHAS